MKRLPIIILLSATILFMVLYWVGDVERDVYAPYQSVYLLPVDDVTMVVQNQVDPARVFLSIEGTMRDWCGALGEPDISFLGEVYQVAVPILDPAPCDVPRSFEKRFELLPLVTESGVQQFVDVNGYSASFRIDPESPQVQFLYTSDTYLEYPPSYDSDNKAELLISIPSLEEEAPWLRGAYLTTPVNFAGRFVVLQGDCLDGQPQCFHYVIVDGMTGRTVQSLSYQGYPAGFIKDSRLFVINDPYLSNIDTPEEVKFMLLEDVNNLPRLDEIAVGVANQYDRDN